ncbi:MAG TPA: heat-inducible transcriptional repressor HrcA [Thermodesulfovibrionales bacterium]|nr:heat-inducible transcriptional repressor HrcA [Thermodesulfovibrionales bacterium]
MVNVSDMLDERSRKILCAVIRDYINFPDPVGSRTVARKYSLGISPATVRNIMADLEELGFLKQPHTSAGRVPTDMGYRFYVDFLIAEKGYSDKDLLQDLYGRLDDLKDNIDMLFSETTKTISLLSHYLGVAMSPKPDIVTLKKVKLLQYRADTIVATLFTDEGMIKNKFISLDLELTQKDLNRIAGYLSSEFSGYTFHEIRMKIIHEMSKEKSMWDSLISKALKICQEAFFSPHGDLFISGLSGVLDLPDFADLQKIKELSRAIEDKHTIIKLLDKLSEFGGVQIIIGSENSLDEMKDFSVVVSACKDDNKSAGVIGIIGPTRMNYQKAISIVDNTARFITRMLSER